ncbi:MAG: flagellar biosynthesis anti-sigma factor FlgM [Deltaproteobacteria bacterium]|nr:flagellar biosynthesis anti-sigma factor FlgM [Deltaproteobacteria bacterium]
MKISNSTPSYINQTYASQANNVASQNLKHGKNSDETLSDSISFSGRTKDLQKISKAMETEPQDREKLVADIKQKVETNQYNINAETVADKMVGFIMNEIG